MQFSDLALHPFLMRAVRDMGFETPTPIQAKAVPTALTGRDLIGCAATGTGKTAAFVLPILNRLLEKPGRSTRALILTPTRELAAQIDDQIAALAKHTRIRSATVFGGVGFADQERSLDAGVDIVVACPGRLLDHMGRGVGDFRDLNVLVLDEADRMMDMGFLPDVKRILDRLPARRQTLLFSATMPEAIRRLADEFLVNPTTVAVEARARPPATIRHSIFPVPAHLKFKLLVRLLRSDKPESVLIFTRTKRGADKLTRFLRQEGFDAGCLHGDRSQNQRTAALDRFRSGRSGLLVATDIMQRGIDVQGVTHVINYDVPRTPEDYIHRIGRTGRAEATGDAFSLVTDQDEPTIRDIERTLGERLTRERVPDFDYSAAGEPRAPGRHPRHAPPPKDSSRRGGFKSKKGRPGERGGGPNGFSPASFDRRSRAN